MDYGEEYKKRLDYEIEYCNNYLYKKYGKEFVDNIFKLADEYLDEYSEEAIKKQFDNLVSYKDKNA